MKKMIIGRLFFSLLALFQPALSLAQESLQPSLNLNTAVEQALSAYPAVRVVQAQSQAASAGVDLALTAYLPRADLIWQQNRATRNNIGGLLVSWEPFDFGLRKANVNLARAQTDQAQASETVTRLDVSAAAADAFLTLLANEQTVRAAQANVERMEIFAKAVHTLVDNQLRPGVDASRANAELAAARNQWIQAQQSAELARADLAQTIGQGAAPA